MITYGIYKQRSHDAILVNRVRTAETAKRQARERARRDSQQYFVDEERSDGHGSIVERVGLFQTEVGLCTEPTPGIKKHGRSRFS